MEARGVQRLAGQLNPDIIRNLKATTNQLRGEKGSAVHELKKLQSSLRATRMTEVTKENRVLLDEVDRLRQMNSVLKQQLAVKEESAAGQIASLRKELQQCKQERKACICLATQQDTWTRQGWGYDEQDTAKQLLARSHCAYDAIFNALRFCVENSASLILQASNASGRKEHPVDMQIRTLMDFLAQQGFRMQKEVSRVTGQPAVCETDNAHSKSPVKNKAQKPKRPPSGITQRLNAACLAVNASVEVLKTVSQATFANNAEMRASARSLGAGITAFVKLHTQLEPSLTIPRSAPHVAPSCAPGPGQILPSTQGLVTAAQHCTPRATSTLQPELPTGFFGAASLQSKGSGVSFAEVPSINGSFGSSAVQHINAPTAESVTCGQESANLLHHNASADGQPVDCDQEMVEDRGPENVQTTEFEAVVEDPAKMHSTDGTGSHVPTDSALPPGDGSSQRYTTSISSSVFSDGADVESSQLPKNSEVTYSQRRSLSQSATSALGVDTPASSVSLQKSNADCRSRPFEVASGRSDAHTSDRWDTSESKQLCSDRSTVGNVEQASTHPAASISAHEVGAECSDIKREFRTDYSYSEAETEL